MRSRYVYIHVKRSEVILLRGSLTMSGSPRRFAPRNDSLFKASLAIACLCVLCAMCAICGLLFRFAVRERRPHPHQLIPSRLELVKMSLSPRPERLHRLSLSLGIEIGRAHV